MDTLIELVVFLVWGTISGGFALWAWRRKQRVRPVLAQLVALDVQWQFSDKGTFQVDGVTITVRTEHHDDQVSKLSFHWPELPGTTLGLQAESLTTQLAGEDLVIGDRGFDDDVQVRVTDDAVALAVLDDSARRRVRAAVMLGAVFRDDHWQLLDVHGDAELPSLLKRVTKAHRSMRVPASTEALVKRLEHLATADPVADVRLTVLQLLLRRGLARPGLLARCRGDITPAVRFAAAAASGPEGRDTLEALRDQGSRTWRTQAAALLLASGADEASEDVLIDALGDDELVVDAAEVLGRHGSARVLPSLGAAHAQRPHRALQEAISQLRQRVGGPGEGAVSLAVVEGGELSEAVEG
jgi:hypothetical protein